MNDGKATNKQMLKIFPEKTIGDRFTYLKNKMNDFIENSPYKDLVECNDRILMHVVIDYFTDISRLKDFHDIDKVKTNKINAYTVSWIIKRKPLQFMRLDHTEKDIFVNERFVLFYILNECLIDFAEAPILSADDMVQFDQYLELILYYLKYRECNPQVIELMLESFKMGRFVTLRDNQ